MIRKKFFCLLILAFNVAAVFSQSASGDLDLLRGKVTAVTQGDAYTRAGNDKEMMQVQKSSFFAKYNPVSLLLKGTMYTYQHVISPQLSRSCPYEITCSNFSKQSIKTFGVVKGVFISADRILRCNRIGILDVHPLDFNDMNGTISDSPSRYR